MTYISLKQASQISGYHPDYLGQLIRKKKLLGKKIGRNWLTTEEAVRFYFSSKKFLSINDFLASILNLKKVFVLIMLVILVTGSFLTFVRFQPAAKEMENKEKIKEVRITNYFLEDGEEEKIEIR